MSEISIVAAVADNYAIGKGNKLPWHLPADLKHFRELTTGHAVVMGKRTFESLPNGPLPNRKNVVLTSVMSEGVNEGYFEADSLEDALYLCEKEDKVFIVGGAAVYRQSLEIADSLYITWVHHEFSADIYFPEVDFSKWEEVSRQDLPADDKNPYPYSFVHYKRKK
ncbi:MAG: dihydrofolate reductase [Paludibacter sp.]|jgi:dihydrofolate reductase|nr:dihydrofolate reductase [Paludibacter sp.]MDD3489293.1 dihydrofolate reductase [Paludibacter sp.]